MIASAAISPSNNLHVLLLMHEHHVDDFDEQTKSRNTFVPAQHIAYYFPTGFLPLTYAELTGRQPETSARFQSWTVSGQRQANLRAETASINKFLEVILVTISFGNASN